MKKIFYTLAIVLGFTACSEEELGNQVAGEQENTLKSTQSLNRTISVFNPITLEEGDFIEGGIYPEALFEDGTLIITPGRGTQPIFSRGHMTIFRPKSTGGQSEFHVPVANGRWSFVGNSNNFELPVLEDFNRWYIIDGEPYFLFDGAQNLFGENPFASETTWIRVAPNAAFNTGNLEVVEFTSGVPNRIGSVDGFSEELATQIKKTIIYESTPEEDREGLDFIYVSFKTGMLDVFTEGYDELFVEANALPSAGANISGVRLFIDGLLTTDTLINRERFAPYEWGAADQRPNETLGFSSNRGSFQPFDMRLEVTDTDGNTSSYSRRFAIISRTLTTLPRP